MKKGLNLDKYNIVIYPMPTFSVLNEMEEEDFNLEIINNGGNTAIAVLKKPNKIDFNGLLYKGLPIISLSTIFLETININRNCCIFLGVFIAIVNNYFWCIDFENKYVQLVYIFKPKPSNIPKIGGIYAIIFPNIVKMNKLLKIKVDYNTIIKQVYYNGNYFISDNKNIRRLILKIDQNLQNTIIRNYHDFD